MEDTKEIYANFKEQVRREADIVRIISEYVPLKKKGGRYWGCCPFHGEKTPSFTVDEGKGLFHCFGCGAGGDVFSFIMKQENLSFVDALKFLANKFNIPIPEKEKNAAEIARELEAKEVYTANQWAAKFFHSCLLNTNYGKKGLAYLQNRGIGREIITKFDLGLAPEGFDKLYKGLLGKGVQEATIVKAGLANRNDKGGIYDKFRARIMIPIKNPRGKVVGFTGRILDKNSSPAKYMNTGDTPWFHKGNLLFGLDAALASIRKHKQVVVVEGHMDAISLHAAGIDWAVASMGTAFTEHQAAILRRLVPEVVFSFDSDAAGKNAAMRAIPLAKQAGLKCKVMHVPEGKDPDDFVRKQGPKAFVELIEHALPGVDYEINTVLVSHDLNSLSGKVEAVDQVIPFIASCESEVEIGERLRDLARTLAIDEGLIQSEYRKLTGRNRREVTPVVPVKAKQQVGGSGEQAERLILYGILVGEPLGAQKDLVQKSLFTGPRQEIFDKLVAKHGLETKIDARDLFPEMTDAGAGELTSILELDVADNNLPQMLEDCFKQLRLEGLQKEFQYHSQQAELFEKTDNAKFMQELAECQRIRKIMAEYTTNKNSF